MNPNSLVAAVGNPNAGKSALFNALTGARQKVGTDLAEPGLNRVAGGAQVGDRKLDIDFLRLERGDAAAKLGDRGGHLHRVMIVLVIEVEEIADLGQAETDAFSPEDQLQPRAVAAAVDAGLSLAGGMKQAAVLIEAQGAGGDAELEAELADRIAALRAVCGRWQASLPGSRAE